MIFFVLKLENNKNIDKMYHYEKNSQKEWTTYIFLGRVRPCHYVEIWIIVKKVYRCEKTVKSSEKHKFYLEGYASLLL